MPTVTGVHGGEMHYRVFGAGPPLLLGYPFAGTAPGVDESLADAFLAQLTDQYRVILVDHPRGIGHSGPPVPQACTADQVCAELLAVATDAGARRFTYWGYSWGGVVGLQLACRTDRLTGLVVGGWPPRGAPYDDLRRMADSALDGPALPEAHRPVVEGWSTFYRSLAGWDENEVSTISCPKMAYIGGDDTVVRSGVTVRLRDIVAAHQDQLARQAWTVTVVPGLDHTGAMLDAGSVVPHVRRFLDGLDDHVVT